MVWTTQKREKELRRKKKEKKQIRKKQKQSDDRLRIDTTKKKSTKKTKKQNKPYYERLSKQQWVAIVPHVFHELFHAPRKIKKTLAHVVTTDGVSASWHMPGVSDRTPDGYHGGISKDEKEIPVIRELPSVDRWVYMVRTVTSRRIHLSVLFGIISIDPGRESLISAVRHHPDYGKSILSFSRTNKAKKSIGEKMSTVEDKHFWSQKYDLEINEWELTSINADPVTPRSATYERADPVACLDP